MTDAKANQSEPSMEEILASIRRIISEDAEPGKAGAAPAEAPAPVAKAVAPAPAPAEPAKPDVLELTEMVEDDGSVTRLDEPPPSEPEPARPPTPRQDDGEGLVSQTAAAAAVSALAGLHSAARRDPEASRTSLGIGNGFLTLEEMVRAELRPILKDWLDANLPGMVERLVQKEIKRITRQVEET